ncbi:MAG TPA: DNA mismatch repair protein MutS [Candidatus Wujingus californicus]|uniref:DNA mismatch repair protein MutS n=2 Tax=Candidatus Wujingus californicus TaxID=3367618 RepID=UPI002713A919|nr:DNA mismatch repair protein MutS [Candidatus Brocadiales bacterium]
MITETPMMRQYTEIKRQHKDALLFFRMGDFYEMFFEDAKLASKVLGITLTSRSKAEGSVPMAGVPHHSADSYIRRLIKAGYKVAICDQLQDPEEAKGIVDRGVTRIITPGTITEDAFLEDKSNNFLIAVIEMNDLHGLSWVDLSTGRFEVEDIEKERLFDEFARLNPAEVLLPEETASRNTLFVERMRLECNGVITPRPDWEFSRDTAYRTLLEHFGTTSLEGFGCEDMGPSLGAAGAVIQYLKETQKTSLKHIGKIQKYQSNNRVLLDRVTQHSLELTQTMRMHDREGSLLGVLDETKTPMGARLLREWLISPLRMPDEIRHRQLGVKELFEKSELRREIRNILSEVYDVERISSKISCGRANARDMIGLKQSLSKLPALKEKMSFFITDILVSIEQQLDTLEEVRTLIGTAIVNAPPITIKDGGIIREGYDAELDELRYISRNGKNWIANFQAAEIARTGINTLKVGYNRVFGYYIEITNVHKDKIPEGYIRKQTLKNAERFITPELKDYETKVLTADERAKDMEYDLFIQVRDQVSAFTPRLQATSEAVALIDVLSALANTGVENRYIMPEIKDSLELKIIDGRHPVLDRRQYSESFVPNDINLNGTTDKIMIITGPNMAGKSTYIRQVALLVLMAQMGSFIPAKEAVIGTVDRIFTRVGASDELSRGQSTFMVEMNETANIINNASERSLIILDEVGRGTSTFDGVSIAWAITEYIYQHIRARTLFATHYHELTELALLFPGIRNFNIAVKEWGDEIIFLRKIIEGGTDKSYGIHVARLAGIPKEVIQRARIILDNLEAATLDINGKPKFAPLNAAQTKKEPAQLRLFASKQDVIIEEIKRLDTTRISPIEALNKLDELKKRLGDSTE